MISDVLLPDIEVLLEQVVGTLLYCTMSYYEQDFSTHTLKLFQNIMENNDHFFDRNAHTYYTVVFSVNYLQ